MAAAIEVSGGGIRAVKQGASDWKIFPRDGGR